MINISFITRLHQSFPNAKISDPFMNSSYLFDKNKNMIGHFDYNHEQFYLNEDYEYIKEAKHVLDENSIDYAEKEYSKGELIYT